MNTDFEEIYHSLEEKHWWFVGRREIILKLMEKVFLGRRDINILEIGCSGGPLLNLLLSQGYSHVVGIDNSKEAIRLCKERGFKDVFLMDGVKPRFSSQEFDLIIASDVLEHIKDDKRAVREWKRILKRKGIIICFVPALKILWSKHDEDNKHCRRYTMHDLVFLFEKNEFKIIRSSYWNLTLFIPALLLRYVTRICLEKFSMNQLKQNNLLLNFFLTQVLRIENFLLAKGINYPFGISTFVIAQNQKKM